MPRSTSSDANPPVTLLRRLFRRLRKLPDLRLRKVLASRRQISSGVYDDEVVVNEVVNRIENEVGVLMRRKPLEELIDQESLESNECQPTRLHG